uniref:N-acetyltransferase domain-containing protein n=2 Tax=Gadus morhua TaxID=8049 RepID=A0A8C5BNQ3_GADMO
MLRHEMKGGFGTSVCPSVRSLLSRVWLQSPTACLVLLLMRVPLPQPSQRGDTMDRLRIREYRSEDYQEVRRLYAAGFSEKTHSLFVHVLTRPWVQLALLAPLLGVLVLSGSALAALAAAALLLSGTRLAVGQLLDRGVRLGLREDLQDIGASYMTPGRVACFWVAEDGPGGPLVGTVGVLPCVTQPGAWELKRISVRRDQRGRGVARALCGEAVAFAARSGVRRMVLYTSMLQDDAQRLYLRLGFRKVEEFLWPSLAARLVGFTVFKYGYDVPPLRDA